MSHRPISAVIVKYWILAFCEKVVFHGRGEIKIGEFGSRKSQIAMGSNQRHSVIRSRLSLAVYNLREKTSMVGVAKFGSAMEYCQGIRNESGSLPSYQGRSLMDGVP
jgi:hypothetical protein